MIDKVGFLGMLLKNCPELSPRHIEEAFSVMDQNRDGFVSMKKLFVILLGQLSQLRETMITEMFKKLDRDCDGQVTYTELIRRFDPTNHSEVNNGAKTAVQVLHDFVKEFDGGVHRGAVTFDEFFTYWMTQSKAIEDDNMFAEHLHMLWNSNQVAADQDHKLRRSTQVGAKLRSTSSPAVGMASMTPAGFTVQHGRKKHLQSPHETGENAANLGFTTGWHKDAFAAGSKSRQPQSSGPRGSASGSPLHRLRAKVCQRGEDNMGNRGYGRKFLVADQNKDGKLDRDDFSRMLELNQVECTSLEEEQLWKQFDKEGLGQIDFPAFILALRGGMNTFRTQLVDRVFDRFDTDHNGIVDIFDIRSGFRSSGCSKHTDKGDVEVFKEFLVGFGDSNRDGRVTREEFCTYYAGVSAFIDKDSYFELMMRNCWHISGGTGQSANTSNLRVCVTFAGGEEEWVTLEDDMGLDLRSPDAAAQVINRLKMQGYRGIIDVDWHGAV